MQKPQVLAKNINNLTDARYFSAMGVDYLGFELSASNAESVAPALVKQLKGWVTGPECIGSFSGFESVDKIKELMLSAELDGVCLEAFAPEGLGEVLSSALIFREAPVQILGEITLDPTERLIINYRDVQELESALIQYPDLYNYKLWLDGPMDQSLFDSGVFPRTEGIVVRGGEEEKIGFKSYEELDFIFDQLEKIL
jgi:phosphoribosylanthranilate isomerase